MPHVLAQDLRDSILQAAIQGKLTVQNSNDYSAYELVSEAGKILTSDTINGQRVKKKEIVPLSDNDTEFEIPDNWCWTRLGAVCVIARGGSPRPIKSYITNREDGINWIKIGDTEKNGKYISSTKEKIIPEGMKKSRFVHAGDFLLTNSMSFGRPYILKIDGCIHDGWLVISQPTEVFNQDYLYYLLSSGYAYKQFSDLTSGAVVQNLNSDKVANAVFPVPPIEEQARIVARVDELMAKIDEYEKIEKELVELQKAFPGNMKDAILQAAMQGKLTEQLAEDTDINEYYKEILSEKKIVTKKEKEVPFVGDEPFDIPSNWMWVQLNDLVGKEIRRGKSPTYAKTGEAMAFAQKCNSKYTGIRLDLALCLDDKSLSKYAEHDRLHDMDVVINSTGGGTLGRIGLYKDAYNPELKAYYPDSHVTVVRAKKCVNPLYIFRCLQFYSPYLETLGEGSTNQTELKADVVKGLYIPLPPLEEQQRIVDKLDQLLPLCEQLEKMAA